MLSHSLYGILWYSHSLNIAQFHASRVKATRLEYKMLKWRETKQFIKLYFFSIIYHLYTLGELYFDSNLSCPIGKLHLYHVSMRFIVESLLLSSYLMQRVIRFATTRRGNTQLKKAGTFYCASNGRLGRKLFMFSHSLYHFFRLNIPQLQFYK